MEAIITVGISGSGKTTWAEPFCKKEGYINVNRDNVRFTLFGCSDFSDYKFTNSREKLVTDVCNSTIEACAKDGNNVVISDTNLNQRYRQQLANKLIKLGYSVFFKEFPISWEEACKRDSSRKNGVGRKVLYSQWNQWLKYSARITYIPDQDLPTAAIFDMDGTLAQMDGRKPFEWHRVGEDFGNFHVIDMLKGYRFLGYKIVILSGRDSVCREETIDWLRRYQVTYEELFMRAVGDQRKDTVIKEELFFNHVAPKYNVQVVVDDRTCMLDMWNDLGLNVVGVGDYRDVF